MGRGWGGVSNERGGSKQKHPHPDPPRKGEGEEKLDVCLANIVSSLHLDQARDRAVEFESAFMAFI